MKDFKDKVAVVTGAASGIGRAMAERFAAEGMKVVLADIEEGALAETAQRMEADGATVLTVRTDVSVFGDVEALANKAVDAFGAVHVLCNNAGVVVGGVSWERTLKDWQWVLGVNLWGVIHGIRTFVPIMVSQDTEGHIVNSGSLSGLTSIPLHGVYQVTKHGVVTLSESLHHELALSGAKVKVSVLCPGMVNTRLIDSERNRPAELQNEPSEVTIRPEEEAFASSARQLLAEGLRPEQVADHVINAIRNEDLYILTHPEANDLIRTRMEAILGGRNSTFRTVLFTDVEGSTALTDRLGDAKARELLREHERIVRWALKAHGGSEVKTTGDGFMASFSSSVAAALECAIAIQRAFAERNQKTDEPIKVRIGLNAGEPIAEKEDLFGTAVNEAARITATARGGEILVADVIRQLAKGKDFPFADRGETSLRGLEDPVRLYEVSWEN